MKVERGYWNYDKFIRQTERELRALLNLQPKSAKWRHFWVFDHCKYHAAIADDALAVNQMNVKP